MYESGVIKEILCRMLLIKTIVKCMRWLENRQTEGICEHLSFLLVLEKELFSKIKNMHCNHFNKAIYHISLKISFKISFILRFCSFLFCFRFRIIHINLKWIYKTKVNTPPHTPLPPPLKKKKSGFSTVWNPHICHKDNTYFRYTKYPLP